MSDTKIQSVTDKPITSLAENHLGIESYAKALAQFITNAATPLSIGIQGEWGTGKTSLMHLIKEELGQEQIATSWVNTWEYSMFKNAEETIPSVLKGLLENLILECKEQNFWPNQQEWDEKKEVFAKALKTIGTIAVKGAVKKTTGQDIPLDFGNSASLISEVAELKNEIQEVVNVIIESTDNPLHRIVLFVDDLDRLDPKVAVGILEALKNVFDLDNCIFVLAIDYEVVIKGLEEKFGPKTPENEREFRSFFDKIIQLPFSMPVSAFKVDEYLKSLMDKLGVSLKDDEFPRYVTAVQLTVGYTPRSIKRYINSFSLLRNMRQASANTADCIEDDFCLFALLGIQVSTPEIFRLLSRQADFENWDANFCSSIDVSIGDIPEHESEFLDEDWEKIVWLVAQKDAYLKTKAPQIILLMNMLKEKYGPKTPEMIEAAMGFASITAVDDDVESKATRRFKAPEGKNVADLLKEVILEFIESNDNRFTAAEAHKILEKKHPGVSKGAVNAALAAYSTNHPSKKHYKRAKDKADCDWFEYLGRGKGFKYIGS